LQPACFDQRNDEVMRVATIERSGFIEKAAAVAGLVLLAAMLGAGAARAAGASSAPAALVMELSGATKPPLAVHREVAPGNIELVPGARLSLLHYATCSIVTFSGGTVKVSEQGLDAAESNIESRKPGPCPHVHKIAMAGPGPLGGGIVSRAISRDPEYAEVASDGLVILTGPRAANAVSANILDSNRRTAASDIPIREESFRLDGSLPPKRPYFVHIHFRGRQEPVEVPISISASNTRALLILKLE
jgi:hypothetical protein